ncbi:MAG TPA: hypothetical protein PK583_01410 [Gammaproteobacteria bacterium]|nr:hypothetical protein [Gammaproteobacteria bacterium]
MSHRPLTTNTRPKMREQIEKLASSTGKTTSFLAVEAIEPYLIERAVKTANCKNAKLIEHEKVTAWLNSWGTEKEQAPPE